MFIKKFNSLSRFRKRVKFFEAYFQTELNSLSHLFKKEFNSLSHTFKKTLVLWVIFIKKFNSLSDILKKGFKSLRHIQEIKRFNSKNISILCVGFTNSILWVFFYWWKNFESWKKGSISLNQKFSKKFKYLSHVKKKVQFFDVKKVQVFESWKKEGTVLWVKLRKKVQFFESYIQQKNSILWVISKKGSILSILWVFFFKKKNSILKLFKNFNSVSQF